MCSDTGSCGTTPVHATDGFQVVEAQLPLFGVQRLQNNNPAIRTLYLVGAGSWSEYVLAWVELLQVARPPPAAPPTPPSAPPGTPPQPSLPAPQPSPLATVNIEPGGSVVVAPGGILSIGSQSEVD